VLSNNAHRDGDISAPTARFAACFEDPDKLLGRGSVAGRCKVVNDAIKHDFQPGHAAKYSLPQLAGPPAHGFLRD
jgi:hypothetical protein